MFAFYCLESVLVLFYKRKQTCNNCDVNSQTVFLLISKRELGSGFRAALEVCCKLHSTWWETDKTGEKYCHSKGGKDLTLGLSRNWPCFIFKTTGGSTSSENLAVKQMRPLTPMKIKMQFSWENQSWSHLTENITYSVASESEESLK